MKVSNFIFSIFLIIGLISCAGEPKPTGPTTDSLVGKWELQEAFTNNKPTQRLNGAFLQFNKNGTVTTNILGTEETVSYELNKNTIIQKTGTEVKYEIEKLESNDLSMVMDLASRKFKLKLSKAE